MAKPEERVLRGRPRATPAGKGDHREKTRATKTPLNIKLVYGRGKKQWCGIDLRAQGENDGGGPGGWNL